MNKNCLLNYKKFNMVQLSYDCKNAIRGVFFSQMFLQLHSTGAEKSHCIGVSISAS